MKKGDFLVIAAVLVLSLLLFAASLMPQGKIKAQVYFDGEIVKQVCLSDLDESESFTVGGCTLSFDKTGAVFASSDCDDRLCMKHGQLTKNGDSMACVPNKVVLVLTAEHEDDFDIMAY